MNQPVDRAAFGTLLKDVIDDLALRAQIAEHQENWVPKPEDPYVVVTSVEYGRIERYRNTKTGTTGMRVYPLTPISVEREAPALDLSDGLIRRMYDMLRQLGAINPKG